MGGFEPQPALRDTWLARKWVNNTLPTFSVGRPSGVAFELVRMMQLA